MKVAHSCLTLTLYSPWNSPGQNTEVGSLSLLQGFFPTQGLNLGLTRCRRILYQLSHKESPDEATVKRLFLKKMFLAVPEGTWELP